MSLTAAAFNAIQDQFNDPSVHRALALLTSRQKTFVLGIMIDGLSATASAKKAGFSSGNHATVLMKNPNVIAAIQAMQVKYANDLDIGMEEVKEGLLDAINVARATNNAMAMIAGWREIGKLIGAYKEPEKNVNININDQAALENVPTTKLIEYVGANVLEGYFEHVEKEDQSL